jgi:hypothetical protein
MRSRLTAAVLATLFAATGLIGCPQPVEEPPREASDVQLLFDPALPDGFWSFPFPNDLRLIEGPDGGMHPDLWDFPDPGESETLRSFIEFASTQQGGFGLNAPTYFRFDGPIEELTYDKAAAGDAQGCAGPVRIVDVDIDSPFFGECLPVRYRWQQSDMGDPWLGDNMAMIGPWWGFPMRGATTYAVYMVDVQDTAGRWLEGPAGLQALLAGTSSDAALQAVYQPLADLLAADPGALGDLSDEGPRWIAAATVFTTQDLMVEMELLADRVLSDPDLPAWNEDELFELHDDHPEYTSDYPLFEGSYTALNFQEGELPYMEEGGGFVWEGDDPIPQWEESIPFVIGGARAAWEQPDAGWPLILHAHGTGGDRYSHLSGGSPPAGISSARGFVSIGIPQPIHGDRWPDGNELAISLYSFNYFNPDSGVSMFRQAALDTVALARFVREEMAEGGAIAQAHPELRINPDEVYFLGHSQGGITGAIALPFTEGVKGWVFSGAGGGLSMTIMQREDPLVIRDALLIATGAPEGIDAFEMHPLVGLVQAAAERTDPINYAPRWVAESTGAPVSVLLTSGLYDAQTPVDTAEALAVAGRLPIAQPHFTRDVEGLELRGLSDRDCPYSANSPHPDGTDVTVGLAQFFSQHWAIFDEPEAALLWANFLYSMVRDGGPGELGAEFP